MPYCSTKLEWCKEEQQPSWGATQPCSTLAGTFRCSDVFCFLQQWNDPWLYYHLCTEVCCQERWSPEGPCCHWNDPGMGIPQPGIAEKYFILQSYNLQFIGHCSTWLYVLYVPVFRRRKGVLTCVNVGRGLFPPAVLTDMSGVLLCAPLCVGLLEKLVWVLIEYTEECTHTNLTHQYKVELDVRGTREQILALPVDSWIVWYVVLGLMCLFWWGLKGRIPCWAT